MKTINRHGFCHQGIFRVNGLQAELNKLQEAFEAGEDPLIPASLSDELDFDINSIAGLLKVRERLQKLSDHLISCLQVKFCFTGLLHKKLPCDLIFSLLLHDI